MTEQENKDLKQYVSDVESMVITTIDQRVIAILSQDLLTRAIKDKEMLEKVREWQTNAPISIQHYSNTVPIHTIRESLVVLNDSIKRDIGLHCDMLYADQRIALEQAVSNAIANFEKSLRPYISK